VLPSASIKIRRYNSNRVLNGSAPLAVESVLSVKGIRLKITLKFDSYVQSAKAVENC
jgi:hypothetical protein